MCCFSGMVDRVSSTRIFARDLDGGDELLVYAMQLDAAADLAMVLPLPVPPASADDAVTFISLAGQARFFDELEAAFPQPLAVGVGPGPAGPPGRGAPPLVVHQVGAFEASFVPAIADFDRLDPRFRLAPGVWDALPGYADWGFAVFKLRAGAGQDVHPMAFRFPRRDRSALFFPTVHVHDGTVPPRAWFDHTFYCQPSAALAATLGWEQSSEPLRDTMSAAAGAVVDLDAPAYKADWHADLVNEDFVLRPLAIEGPAALIVDGPSHRLRLRVSAAYQPAGAGDGVWRRTARDRAGAVAAALGRLLLETTAAEHDAWGLAAYDAALPEHPIHGPPGWSPPPGPCRMKFWAHAPALEQQTISLAFANPPTPAIRTAVQTTFTRLLDLASRA